jgi:hypothetical protein
MKDLNDENILISNINLFRVLFSTLDVEVYYIQSVKDRKALITLKLTPLIVNNDHNN